MMKHVAPIAFLMLLVPLSMQLQDLLPLCSQLRQGQFECVLPPIDNSTQELSGCRPNGTVDATCSALEGIECEGPLTWTAQIPCRYTNGYSYKKAVGLSVFLGLLGVDRFYLGYPTIGLIKLLTCGGFLIGNWADFILISTQVVKPADGSEYVFSASGPIMSPLRVDAETYRN